MRNQLLLIAYLALFTLLVSNYETYRDNTLAVALAAALLLIAGLLAWLLSIRGSQDN